MPFSLSTHSQHHSITAASSAHTTTHRAHTSSTSAPRGKHHHYYPSTYRRSSVSFFFLLRQRGKNKASSPTFPRIRYMCFNLTRRCRCNSSSRCCCLACEHLVCSIHSVSIMRICVETVYSDSSTPAVVRCAVGICSAVWVDKQSDLLFHTDAQAVFLKVTGLETRHHNIASNHTVE